MSGEVKITNLKKIDISKIRTIYLGKDRVCRCGCAGTYIESGFERRVAKAFRMAQESTTKVTASEGLKGETLINLSYGDNRAITIYFCN